MRQRSYVLAAVLAGCSSSNDSPPVDAAAGTINYRPAFVAMAAGTYTGKCTQRADGQPVVATVSLSSDGQARTTGVDASVLGPSVGIVFTKRFDATGALINTELNASDLDAVLTNFGVRTAAPPELNIAALSTGNANTIRGVICTESTDAPAIASRSPFAAIAQYLVTARRPVNCTTGTVDYEVTSTHAKLGDETYPLDTGLSSQVALVTGATGTLHYSIETLDGRALSIMLDARGALSLVTAKLGNGTMRNCVP